MQRKYLLVLIALTLLLSGKVCSQQSCWTLGVELGTNLSNSTENTAPLEKKCPVLYKMGIFVDYTLFKSFSLQSGLAYIAKGINSSGKGKLSNSVEIAGSIDLTQQVLQIPVYAAYNVDISKSRLIFSTGPYVAYTVLLFTIIQNIIFNKS